MESFQVNQSLHPLITGNYIENFQNKKALFKDFPLSHPIANLQKDSFKRNEMKKMKKCAEIYGTGHALQLCWERNMLANMRRDYPIKSNNLGLNIHCGNYDKIEFNDFLGTDKPFDVDDSLFRKVEKIYLD